MTDRENVIKAIEICYTLGHSCTKCPLFPEDDCNDKLMHDALSLLKEQEPVKPAYEDFFGNRIARCGKCNGYIVRYRYCPGCGQEVKWE